MLRRLYFGIKNIGLFSCTAEVGRVPVRYNYPGKGRETNLCLLQKENTKQPWNFSKSIHFIMLLSFEEYLNKLRDSSGLICEYYGFAEYIYVIH